MISRQDRVQIWAAQLAAKDFPPICAMTGRPAEVSRKFNFYSSHELVVLVLSLAALVGLRNLFKVRRATGYLPLTNSARQLVMLVQSTIALFPLSIMLLVGGVLIGNAYAADPDLSAISRTFIALGLIVLVAFFVTVVLRSRVGPTAKILGPLPGYHDWLIELRRVHPAFVTAVNQRHALRAAQLAAMQAPANAPLPPGSN